jgi:multidrug resistance efflux pump
MDLLLILIYVAIAFAIFKIFKIPVNGFSLLTAALGGVALIGALVLCMNYNHPFTSSARFYFATTPIIPAVSGRVIDVPVEPHTSLKKGDVLFRIDPVPFENAVKAKEALLADAKQVTGQLQAAADTAQQQSESAGAKRASAKDVFDRAQKLHQSGAISEADFQRAKNEFLSADAASLAAVAEAQRARLAADSELQGVNTEVARLEAELATAKFELDQTVVRAPTDGSVIQLFLRPGMYSTAMPLRPVMIFMHDEQPVFTAAFLQNSAQRIETGSEAEIILPAVPGRFFKGKVTTVGAYIAQGQLQPGGTLVDPEQIRGDGRMLVEIAFEPGVFDGFQIVPGSTGQAAVYTEHMHHLAIMRKVLLRMKSWLDYIFSDGH